MCYQYVEYWQIGIGENDHKQKSGLLFVLLQELDEVDVVELLSLE